MKRILFICMLSVLCAITHAQEDGDTACPSFGVDLVRAVDGANINGKVYNEFLKVEIKAADVSGNKTFWRDGSFADPLKGVKVVVRDKNGKKIYKKRFSKAYLYVFKGNSIEIGKGNRGITVALYLHIFNHDGLWKMNINENGIVY